MLRARLILPLAFAASVAFLSACQEQASSPTGPDSGTTVPNFGHNPKAPPVHGGGDGEGNLDGTWNASTAEATASDVRVVEGNLVGPNGSKNTLQTAFNEPIDIDLTGFLGKVDKVDDEDVGDDCFSAEVFGAIMMVGQVTPSNPEDAIINFFFRALGTDGTTAVDYVLKVFAKFQPGRPWPPEDAPLKSNTITGGTFVLAHVNGPGRKFACTGEGDLANFSVTITENATEE